MADDKTSKVKKFPEIIDAHSHVQFPVYDNDRETVINQAKAAGVAMIAVGTQADTSEAAVRLAKANPGWVWATVGFHPNHLNEDWYHDKKEQFQSVPEIFNIDILRGLAKGPSVVAIGECGLDYYRIKNNESGIKDSQRDVFLQQAKLAQELQKPLMIHCRPAKGTDDAYEDLLQLLTKDKRQLTTVIHFYVGSMAITKQLVEAGFYFTFGGVITFSNDYDEIMRYIPADRLLTETDCPYVAPLPYRGRRNEPAYILETVKKMAQLRGISFDTLKQSLYSNTRKVFKI